MIGKILKKMRQEKNLSQKDLAKILSVDQTTVSGWERGYREPTFDVIEKIATICNYEIIFENIFTKEQIDSKTINRK